MCALINSDQSFVQGQQYLNSKGPTQLQGSCSPSARVRGFRLRWWRPRTRWPTTWKPNWRGGSNDSPTLKTFPLVTSLPRLEIGSSIMPRTPAPPCGFTSRFATSGAWSKSRRPGSTRIVGPSWGRHRNQGPGAIGPASEPRGRAKCHLCRVLLPREVNMGRCRGRCDGQRRGHFEPRPVQGADVVNTYVYYYKY